MCGWPPVGKGFVARDGGRSVAVMCTAFWCGATWPLALMGTVDRGPIIATGSRCPNDVAGLVSIAGLTDFAIMRTYPRNPSVAAGVA